MIYLDHASTTQIDPRVLEAMLPFLKGQFGNPSSLHSLGQNADEAIQEARQTIAQVLQCEPEEIIFTSGGTESANLAIQGLLNASEKKHIIVSSIEHSSVLRPAELFDCTKIDPDNQGILDPSKIEAAITDQTALISIQYANNEIGTVQPIDEIAQMAKKHNIFFHTDACQAAGFLPLDTQNLTAMTLNGSKIYGPKGIGILYLQKETPIKPLILGGGQESQLRSGTENVASIVGLREALKLVTQADTSKMKGLRDHAIKRLTKEIEGVTLNGHPEKRLPNNIHITVDGIEGESILLRLSNKGVMVATGSACSSKQINPSHVMLAIGKTKNDAHSSLRITLGKSTTQKDLDQAIEILKEEVQDLRSIYT